MACRARRGLLGALLRGGEHVAWCCRASQSRGAGVSARARGCNWCALGACSARTPDVRHNAAACYRSQVRMGFTRSRLGATGSLVDMLVCSTVQAHSAMPQFMSKQNMSAGCLTKCQWHLGKSWGGQKLQMGVSVEEREGGDVSWTKGETC